MKRRRCASPSTTTAASRTRIRLESDAKQLKRSTRVLRSNAKKAPATPPSKEKANELPEDASAAVTTPVPIRISSVNDKVPPAILTITTPPVKMSDSFVSCLIGPESSTGLDIVARSTTQLLKRALSIDELHEQSWLSSSLIDLVFTKFARCYPEVHFMPIEFAAFRLQMTKPKEAFPPFHDILGRLVDSHSEKPFVFLSNQQNLHWNLLRVQFRPTRGLQLFEPLGKPASRHGVSYRYIPKAIVQWLDASYPCETTSWQKLSCSAITVQHQFTGFDCGVACLLYAEKCGQGYTKEMINESTTQADITQYRRCVQHYVRILQVSTPTAQGDGC